MVQNQPKSNEMMRSDSVCMGLRRLDGEGGRLRRWNGNFDPSDACILAGLTVFHKLTDPEKLRKTFEQFRAPEFYQKCRSPANEPKLIKRFIDHGPGINKAVFNEWKLYFQHFFMRRTFS